MSGTNTLKDRIHQYIVDTDYVTFAELRNRFPDFEGDYEIALTPNVILWSGLSDAASKAIKELLEEKKITGVPSAPLTYLIDGCVLRLPIVKQLARPYKRPHWLPVSFRPFDS